SVLLGWAVDAALGGGVAHAAGWLTGLLLVAGIPALSAWSATHRTDNQPALQVDHPAESDRAIRPARPDELAGLIEIELAADRLFPLAGYGETPGPAGLDDLQAAEALLVSGDPPV